MPSLPPSAGATPAAPPPAPVAPRQCVRWLYVDQARRHDVRVGLRGGGGKPIELFIEERGDGGDEVLETVRTLEGLWESRVHHLALEERLAALGAYFRHSVGSGGGWTPLRRTPATWTPNLAPLPVPALPGEAQAHFYGSGESSACALVLALPTARGARPRWALARLDFEFPQAEPGRLRLLHPGVGPTLLRSAVAAQDQELQGLRLQKVTALDRQAPSNAEWCAQFDACVATALDRVAKGRFGGTAPRFAPAAAPPPPAPSPSLDARAAPRPVARASATPAGGRPMPARVITMFGEPTRTTGARSGDFRMPERLMSDENPYEIEYDPPDRLHADASDEALEVAKIEESTVDFRTALTHPRILALHKQFLGPGEDEALVRAGESAILAAVQAKRATVPLARQHLLSILEASLLVRHSLAAPGRPLDPRAADLLRRALVYL